MGFNFREGGLFFEIFGEAALVGVVELIGGFEDFAEDVFVGVVVVHPIEGARFEEFNDVVVGIAFEEAFADVDDVDEFLFVKPEAEELDHDVFVFVGEAGGGLLGDVFGKD